MTSSETRFAASNARIATIARSTETVSLDLLRAIDETVGALTGVAKIASGLAELVAGITTEVTGTTSSPGAYIDPDDKIIDTMMRTAGELKNSLTALVRRRTTIDGDGRLRDHHSEALHEAFEAAIGAIAELAENLDTARAAIITHDLKAEPRDGAEVFATVNDLISHLHR